MAGPDPAIHVLLNGKKPWMPGTRPGMTQYESSAWKVGAASGGRWLARRQNREDGNARGVICQRSDAQYGSGARLIRGYAPWPTRPSVQTKLSFQRQPSPDIRFIRCWS